MKWDYDLITIGLGPAGMAVSAMGSEMGLRVCAIEKNKIGGECMNVGCIPSKALLRMAKTRHQFDRLSEMELSDVSKPDVLKPFERIARSLDYINTNKNAAMFTKVDLVLEEGSAKFVDAHTVEVGGRKISAKRIYIAAGTRPAIPPIDGIDQIDLLTNENLFKLDAIPESMIIIGGGAIGTEMAQAFTRLGCRCSVVHLDPHLVVGAGPEAGQILEEVFENEKISVSHGVGIRKAEKTAEGVRMELENGEVIEGERLLVAAGRAPDYDALNLEAAGVDRTEKGFIKVNRHLRTTASNIYAVGDCNGHHLFSHAAMHQGMLALMNSMIPGPFKFRFKKFVVPWTVFTDPAISFVGETEEELKRRNVSYEVIQMNYDDYGAAIAEEIGVGFVRVLATRTGKVLGVTIVGEGSGEMINEWALIIQNKIRLHKVMFLQHSFPTMGFLSKRASEQWMMNRMESSFMKKMCQFFF